MTQDGLHIDQASLRNLHINMRVFQREVLAASVDGLKQFGARIVVQAQEFLDHNGQRATSKLIGSGRTVVQPDNTVDAGFYTAYAEYVEYGRRSGRMPPVEAIEQNLIRKGRRVEKEGKSALKSASVFSGKSVTELAHESAWAIAKSIAKKGTKPHPFLKPAYDMYRPKIGQFMQQQINQVVDRFKPKK